MEIKEKHAVARRKANGLRLSAYSESLWINGDNEANYLLGGNATELLDSICLDYSTGERAKIYGIVAANREKGRYVWIYLYSHNRIWRCHSIPGAYKIIEKLKEYNEAYKLEKKLYDKWLIEERKQKNTKLVD